MKKNILSIALIIFASLTLSAQIERKNDSAIRPTLSVYPNPATEYISVNHEEVVRNIYVFNLVGRKMRVFEVEKGERYEIGDLPNGLYVIQLIGKDSKILTTQRLTKKS
jgi:Secretion system C-terminal sorting domain